MKGDAAQPPVIGLVMVPVSDDAVAAYQADERLSEALGSWMIVRI
jgi:hypothetical protein